MCAELHGHPVLFTYYECARQNQRKRMAQIYVLFYVLKLKGNMNIEHSFCPFYIHIVMPAWSMMSVPSSPATMFASSSAKFSSQDPYRLSLCLLAPSSFGSPFSLHSTSFLPRGVTLVRFSPSHFSAIAFACSSLSICILLREIYINALNMALSRRLRMNNFTRFRVEKPRSGPAIESIIVMTIFISLMISGCMANRSSCRSTFTHRCPAVLQLLRLGKLSTNLIKLWKCSFVVISGSLKLVHNFSICMSS